MGITLLEQYRSKPYDTDKQTIHCYIEQAYNTLFNDNLSVTNILEIGAMNGGSALLWRDYFVNASIDIIDINECKAILNQERINHIVANAYSKNLVKSLRHYDIIIDDGPHTLDSMIFIIDYYIPLLKLGGICVIEDVQYYEWFETLTKKISKEYSYEIMDLRKTKNRYDDLLLIIKRIND